MKALKPLSSIYEKLAGLKNYLYDKEYLSSVTLPIPVLSLGNLTMGGTGKTPMTDFCLQYFKQYRLKTVVVSRNYRAEVNNISQVDISHPQAAAYFGDEPVLLASRHPEVDFYVGPQKFLTAQYAFRQSQPDLLVVDDGFQHRQLKRNIDLLILDATEPLSNYECLPQGRAREAWSSIERATALAVTKVNLAGPEKTEALLKAVQNFGKPTTTFSYELLHLQQVHNGEKILLKDLRGQKVILISGIARPESFERNLSHWGLQIEQHIVFKDHHPYNGQDVADILRKWRAYGEEVLLITTEKDQVKLKSLWLQNTALWYAPLEVLVQSGKEDFYGILDQVHR